MILTPCPYDPINVAQVPWRQQYANFDANVHPRLYYTISHSPRRRTNKNKKNYHFAFSVPMVNFCLFFVGFFYAVDVRVTILFLFSYIYFIFCTILLE